MTKLSRLCAALAAAAGLAMAVSAQAAATIQIINGDPQMSASTIRRRWPQSAAIRARPSASNG
jgi:hypothetical protein